MQQNNNPFKREEMFAEEFATLMPQGSVFKEAGAVIGNYLGSLERLSQAAFAPEIVSLISSTNRK